MNTILPPLLLMLVFVAGLEIYRRHLQRARDLAHFEHRMKTEAESSERIINMHEARARELQSQLAALTPPPRGTGVKGGLVEQDLLDALNVDDMEPLWIAVHQELDGLIIESIEQVEVAAGETLTKASGGLARLRDFQKHLLDRRHLAKARDHDETKIAAGG